MHSPYKKVLFLAIGLLLSFSKLHSMDDQNSYVDIESQQQIDKAHQREGQLATMMATHRRTGAQSPLLTELQNSNLVHKIAEYYEPRESAPVAHDNLAKYVYISVLNGRKLKFKVNDQQETLGAIKNRLRSTLGLAANTPILFIFNGHRLADTLPAWPSFDLSTSPGDHIHAVLNRE